MIPLPHTLFITVNGQWGAFGSWSSCSKTCGGGIKTRQRLCNNPPFSNGGADCIGNRTHQHSCNVNTCPGKKIKNILLISAFT